MHYLSTRGESERLSFKQTVLAGLATDGGLYLPETYPTITASDLSSLASLSYEELAARLLSLFGDDIPNDVWNKITAETYTTSVFQHVRASEHKEDIVPLTRLEDTLFLLNLSTGPTLAFKDIALQLLGRLFELVLAETGEELNILGATSGDTGSAAEYAMIGKKGVRVFMLSPLGRMSAFQRAQMYTIDDPSIHNIAIHGTFDDCQRIVKTLAGDADFKKRYKLGAVNSINWARIAAQVVYYFWGFLQVQQTGAKHISFAVPSGNFGDILAGHIARQMGLPIERLILATNENNVLDEFFKTGTYRVRRGAEVHATSSPSMDIAEASNFERFLFDLVGRDASRVKGLMEEVKKNGMFSIGETAEFKGLSTFGIVSETNTHAGRLDAIQDCYTRYGVFIDPHTADGFSVGRALQKKEETLICLETAQAAKFEDTMKEALGFIPPHPEGFEKLAEKEQHVTALPNDPGAVRAYMMKSLE